MKNYYVFTIACFLLVTCLYPLPAQTQLVSDTLRVNSIQARVQSNGAYFAGGDNGQFLVPAFTGSTQQLSLIKSAGLWLGGRDSAGVVHLSAQLYNENGAADFYPGLLNEDVIPNPTFNFIADVTGAQIDAHKANPTTPIPAVYAWPGRDNPYFFDHYGFELPYSWSGYAGFYDRFGNNRYDPSEGDYPALELRGCPLNRYTDEQMWFAFHDGGAHTQSGAAPMNQQVYSQFFGYNCPEGSPVDRMLFVTYKFINRNPFPLDSCYFGVFLDFQIGNGDDDYIGCDPSQRVVYAYNGDATDEGGFEGAPPVMAVDLLRAPFDPATGDEVTNWHFVPVDDQALTSPSAYYNLLAGRQTNGIPFPNNGRMYTGNPMDPGGWSEASAGNVPGDRKALASFGPFFLEPGAVNELVLGYAWVRKGSNGTVADNFSILNPTMKAVQEVYDNCFELYMGCPGNVGAQEPETAPAITVLPNPFKGWIQIQCAGTPLRTVRMYDGIGRLVRELNNINQETVVLATADLPVGIFGLQVLTTDGQTESFKVVQVGN